MMRVRPHSFVFLFAVTACTPVTLAVAGVPSPLESRVCIASTDGGPVSFELTNVSPTPLSIDASTLPWVWWYGAEISVRDAASGEALERILPIEDPPPPTRVTIEPGDTLRGSVDLEPYFSSLMEMNRDRALTITWALKIKYAGEKIVPIDGTLSIPCGFFARDGTRCTCAASDGT